jgi:hypothetical protein
LFNLQYASPGGVKMNFLNAPGRRTPQSQSRCVKNRFLVFLLACAFWAAPPASAQTGGNSAGQQNSRNTAFIPGGHKATVNAIAYNGRDEAISAGADGFIEIWDVKKNEAKERFQLTSLDITSMIIRPKKTQIAITESDGLALYRVAVWDYASRQNLFTLRFRDPVSYISYSGGGNFLIAARSGRTGVVFINPETGDLLHSPEKLTGQVTFAATGPSEKTMVTYQPSGILSYWELESGNEIRRFNVPSNITSPILFGNNRFLAGFSGALVILDAVSGNVLARNRTIQQGTLMQTSPESTEFVCLSASGQTTLLTHFNLDKNGRLIVKNQRPVATAVPKVTCAAITSNSAALGTGDGSVWNFSQQGTAAVLKVKNQKQILEGAASGGTLAFLAEGNLLGFIPLDFSLFKAGSPVSLQNGENYARISADLTRETGNGGTVMLWQTANTRLFPLVRALEAPPVPVVPGIEENTAAPDPGEAGEFPGGAPQQTVQENPDKILNRFTYRYPLRAAAVRENSALFLDAVGNITVVDINTGRTLFSYSSLGALDAAFLNLENIIIGRSAVSGNTPFLMINIKTGETVPLSYPSAVGARVFQGPDNTAYCAVIDQRAGISTTALISLNTFLPAASQRLIEYEGEDSSFSFAESGGNLAISLGGDGASIYNSASIIPFERSSGIPFKLINGGNYFISIDAEGNICWHNTKTGRLEALLRIYDDEWLLEKRGSARISGEITKEE